MTDEGGFGQALYRAGWRQGALFECPSLEFQRNDLDENGHPQPMTDRPKAAVFVIATQDCDLVSDKEETVEVLPCLVEEADVIEGITLNTSRRFVVDRTARLVADAQHRILLAKKVLRSLTPKPWPSDSSSLKYFRRWLGFRYTRPAIPDPVVEGFWNPLGGVLKSFRDKNRSVYEGFNSAVMEILVQTDPNGSPPCKVRVLLLLKVDSLDDAAARALVEVEKAIARAADSRKVRLSLPFRRATGEQLSLTEYYSYEALPLDYLSYRGGEVVGAESYSATKAAPGGVQTARDGTEDQLPS